MNEQQTPQVLLSTVLVRLNYVELAIQARELERQFAEAKAKLEIETAREECQRCHRHWSPSLIESDVCIFCIHNEAKAKLAAMTKERDELKKSLAEAVGNGAMCEVFKGRLEAERDELLKDKARLDWLYSKVFPYMSLRPAIDQAMKK